MTNPTMVTYDGGEVNEVWINKTRLLTPDSKVRISSEIRYIDFRVTAQAISIRGNQRIEITFTADAWWIYPNPGPTAPVSGR